MSDKSTQLVVAMARYLGPVNVGTLHRRIAGFISEGHGEMWEAGADFARRATVEALYSGAIVMDEQRAVGTPEDMAALVGDPR